jgi:hypothetical protein
MGAFNDNARLKSGKNSWCRDCTTEATRRWRDEHRESINEARRLGEREGRCPDCGEVFTYRSVAKLRCDACKRARKAARERRRYHAKAA